MDEITFRGGSPLGSKYYLHNDLILVRFQFFCLRINTKASFAGPQLGFTLDIWSLVAQQRLHTWFSPAFGFVWILYQSVSQGWGCLLALLLDIGGVQPVMLVR
jgi:hypothetical protein